MSQQVLPRFPLAVVITLPCQKSIIPWQKFPSLAFQWEGDDGGVLLHKEVVVSEALHHAAHIGRQPPQAIPAKRNKYKQAATNQRNKLREGFNSLWFLQNDKCRLLWPNPELDSTTSLSLLS